MGDERVKQLYRNNQSRKNERMARSRLDQRLRVTDQR
jgi:hypothetical protein